MTNSEEISNTNEQGDEQPAMVGDVRQEQNGGVVLKSLGLPVAISGLVALTVSSLVSYLIVNNANSDRKSYEPYNKAPMCVEGNERYSCGEKWENRNPDGTMGGNKPQRERQNGDTMRERNMNPNSEEGGNQQGGGNNLPPRMENQYNEEQLQKRVEEFLRNLNEKLNNSNPESVEPNNPPRRNSPSGGAMTPPPNGSGLSEFPVPPIMP